MNVLVHTTGAVTTPAPGYTAEGLMADYPEGSCEVCAEEDVDTHPDVMQARTIEYMNAQNQPDLSPEALDARITALEEA